ncbi:DUF3159 domain-containing protein [Streptomyces shenzhenensis]|uniref:DUF3159 domain-containing protein n=1 Tax=Streptomyces shenzhenensis TaxID=943815 RepID=UPI00368CF94B
MAFVVANALGGLTWAFIALAVTAPVTFGVRLARQEPLRAALFGLAVAAVCVLVAAVAGEARAFFLLPMLLPAAFMLLFLGSLLARRPLTGVMFNRLARGPHDWRHHGPLRRVYTVTTLVAVAINLVNFVLRVVLCSTEQLVVPAILELAAAPVLLALAAFTLVAARRAHSRSTTVPPTGARARA